MYLKVRLCAEGSISINLLVAQNFTKKFSSHALQKCLEAATILSVTVLYQATLCL